MDIIQHIEREIATPGSTNAVISPLSDGTSHNAKLYNIYEYICDLHEKHGQTCRRLNLINRLNRDGFKELGRPNIPSVVQSFAAVIYDVEHLKRENCELRTQLSVANSVSTRTRSRKQIRSRL